MQKPRNGELRGTFALRSPARPNPIATSVARLVKVDGTRLSVVGLDCLDGTPLIDIKPYFASTDSVPDAVSGGTRRTRADPTAPETGRFCIKLDESLRIAEPRGRLRNSATS